MIGGDRMSPPGPLSRKPVAEEVLRPLDPRAVQLWRFRLAAQTLGLWAAVLAMSRLLDGWLAALPLHALVLVLGLASAAVWPPHRYRSWRFQLRPDALFVRRGVLWRVSSLVPHARIQHVDVRQGPIERWLGLASVVVFTAGIRGAELTIPGLAAGDAEELRDHLASLGGGGDAV